MASIVFVFIFTTALVGFGEACLCVGEYNKLAMFCWSGFAAKIHVEEDINPEDRGHGKMYRVKTLQTFGLVGSEDTAENITRVLSGWTSCDEWLEVNEDYLIVDRPVNGTLSSYTCMWRDYWSRVDEVDLSILTETDSSMCTDEYLSEHKYPLWE